MPPTEERDPGANQRRADGEQLVEMDLAGTLAAAEAASPVESLDVVARMLRDRLNAAAVSFLIVDFTGSSVVRLGAADSVESDEPLSASLCPVPSTRTCCAHSGRPSSERATVWSGPWRPSPTAATPSACSNSFYRIAPMRTR